MIHLLLLAPQHAAMVWVLQRQTPKVAVVEEEEWRLCRHAYALQLALQKRNAALLASLGRHLLQTTCMAEQPALFDMLAPE
jgi:hypothetical protein